MIKPEQIEKCEGIIPGFMYIQCLYLVSDYDAKNYPIAVEDSFRLSFHFEVVNLLNNRICPKIWWPRLQTNR